MISSGVYVNYDETKINVSQIQVIKFVNSSFNEVPDGFFNETLFTKLKKIDLSGVGLMTLDLKDVYVGNVFIVDIRHNNLKTIGINGTSPSSNNENQIEIDNNNWNCVELSSIMSDLTTLEIWFSYSTTTNTTNIHGIKCTCSDDNHILKKLNHMIGKFDDSEVKDQKIKENIQKLSEQMEKMQSRFIEVNKEMSAAIQQANQMNETCNYSTFKEPATSNMKDFLDKQSRVIFDSSIFKVVDSFYGEIFQGYENISMTIKNVKKTIVEIPAIKTEPHMFWKVVEIILITLFFVALPIGMYMLRKRIRSLCSKPTLEPKSVSYLALNHLLED
ncbi:unnamed protein product [Diamesa tonsa]